MENFLFCTVCDFADVKISSFTGYHYSTAMHSRISRFCIAKKCHLYDGCYFFLSLIDVCLILRIAGEKLWV